MPFKDLGLSEPLLRAITERNYNEPTSIQQQAIPLILNGHDLMACSQTGTGKTAGFTLPLLHHLSKQSQQKRTIRALILTPTRELATQVRQSICNYSKYLSLRSLAVFGGSSIFAQIKSLRAGVDILVATPGRLLDHISHGSINLSHVELFVLDEADRMLDMGFVTDIRSILSYLPKQRQNLFFSATFSHEIKKLANSFLNNPKVLEADPQNTSAITVSQVVYPVDSNKKRELLSFLISSQQWTQALVFTSTKHGADKLCKQLSLDGISATAIHGNKTQAARSKALSDFKKGTVRVLVATDIASRGLDIARLPHVVNFELPEAPEDYVHRIGRTGRAGHAGLAISLVCATESKMLKNIERLLKHSIPQETIPGYEPTLTAETAPNRPSRRDHRFRHKSRAQYQGRKPKRVSTKS